MEKQFVIKNFEDSNEEKGLYWNNDSGWGSFVTADVFSEEEQKEVSLPVGGMWMMVLQG